MIECKQFYESLEKAGLDFYTGVPDSLLKNFCFFVDDNLPSDQHVIASNEGAAIGLATGYYMATGKTPIVYLQNSGLGNTINPLLSIADPEVYSIPMLIIIGWRGEPGVKDEPQHKKQGRVMIEMIKSMEIPYSIIDANTDFDKAISEASVLMKEKKQPFVFAVREGTFDNYNQKKNLKKHSLTWHDFSFPIVEHHNFSPRLSTELIKCFPNKLYYFIGGKFECDLKKCITQYRYEDYNKGAEGLFFFLNSI
jgi:phosphonopyruvate decarboxylase